MSYPVYHDQEMSNYRMDFLPRFFGDCCGAFIRIVLFIIVLINLGISSALIQRFTSIDGISVPNAQPPAALIFSEVVAAVSVAWIAVSFCLVRVPVLLLVGDTIFFVAWFAASTILGNSLNQTLRFSCQELAIVLTGSRAGFGTSFGFNSFGGQNTLAQQVFDSCNISKALFSFHIIATILFIGVAMTAAIAASSSRKPIRQQNNFYGPYNNGQTRRRAPGPEIVV